MFEIRAPLPIHTCKLRGVHRHISLSQKYPLTHNTINSATTAAALNNLYSVKKAMFGPSSIPCLPRQINPIRSVQIFNSRRALRSFQVSTNTCVPVIALKRKRSKDEEKIEKRSLIDPHFIQSSGNQCTGCLFSHTTAAGRRHNMAQSYRPHPVHCCCALCHMRHTSLIESTSSE